MGSSDKKLSFALGGKKKKKKSKSSSSKSSSHPSSKATGSASSSSALKDDFGAAELKRSIEVEEINADLPKAPLVIPLQQDSRLSLQEQADGENAGGNDADATADADNKDPQSKLKDDDLAAIQALKDDASNKKRSKKADDVNDDLIIQAKKDKFQRNKSNDKDSDKAQLDNELNKLSSELDVESDAYRRVPIRDFGAALLRGMGWAGQDDSKGKSDTNDAPMQMPRPSRLGLGAIPKLMESDAPQTHSRRPRRQDQAEKERRLKEQQKEFQRQKEQQVLMDKQKTMQIGSIVWVSLSSNGSSSSRKNQHRRRAMMKKLQGVPGLNMVLVQFEDESEAETVKKGTIELVERRDLNQDPFREAEPAAVKDSKPDSEDKKGKSKHDRDDEDRSSRDDRRSRHKRRRDDNDDNDEDDHNDRHRRSRSASHDDRREKKRDRKSTDSKKRRDEPSSSNAQSWLITNIRVRVISKKFGSSHYKQKGVVMDIPHSGKATLRMDHNGDVISASERHLETALPKAGGNAVILMGRNKFGKGKLLERDSKRCKGAVQLFDDMSIVNASLDDLAEWCGPLDDDLME